MHTSAQSDSVHLVRAQGASARRGVLGRGRRFGAGLVVFIALGAAPAAEAITITFNEGLAPGGTQLDGTTFYDGFGVSFLNSLLFGPDSRLPDDGWGITNVPSSLGTVNFFTPVENIVLTWATATNGVTFFATAFDGLNNIVASFSSTGMTASGLASLNGANISRLEYHDTDGVVALDTLSYTPSGTVPPNGPTPVPEPSSLLLVASGIAAVAAGRRRVRRASR